MRKKGVASIIAVVLIMVIVLVAVAIVYNVVIGSVRKSSSGIVLPEFETGLEVTGLGINVDMTPEEILELNYEQDADCYSVDINEDERIDNLDLDKIYNDCKGDDNWCDGADVNRDKVSNAFDLAILRQNSGKTGCNYTDWATGDGAGSDWCNGADANMDGSVNGFDLAKIRQGSNHPDNVERNCRISKVCSVADINGDEIVNNDDLNFVNSKLGKVCGGIERCYVGLEIEETKVQDILDPVTGEIIDQELSFSLLNQENLYGLYDGLVDEYDEEVPESFILNTYDSGNNLLRRYSLSTSRFIFYDNFGDPDNPGGVEELDSGILSSIIYYDDVISFIKIEDHNGVESDLGINVGEISCSRGCKLDGEIGHLRVDKCCNGFNPVQQDSENFVCVNCGDGVCSANEDEHSCYEDCPVEFTCADGYAVDEEGYGCVSECWFLGDCPEISGVFDGIPVDCTGFFPIKGICIYGECGDSYSDCVEIPGVYATDCTAEHECVYGECNTVDQCDVGEPLHRRVGCVDNECVYDECRLEQGPQGLVAYDCPIIFENGIKQIPYECSSENKCVYDFSSSDFQCLSSDPSAASPHCSVDLYGDDGDICLVPICVECAGNYDCDEGKICDLNTDSCVTLPPPVENCDCEGDANGDGVVDVNDLEKVVLASGAIGCNSPEWCDCNDADKNNRVNFLDQIYVRDRLNTICG